MIDLVLSTFKWLPTPLFLLVSAILTFFFIFVAVSVIIAVYKLIQFIVHVLGGILGKVVSLFVWFDVCYSDVHFYFPKLKPRAKPVALSLYFGIPGAGKSTFAAYLAKKDMKKGRKVWSNFGITGAMKCEKSDFGKYMMTDGRLIIDEAGLEYDNRKMAMTNDEIYFFKYHRHYQLDVDFFSQGLDVDIKIRKLARHIYLIKPSLLPFFIKRKEIGRKVGINDMTKEICDEYFFVPFIAGGTKLIFCPPLWKLFNTLSRKPLPEKEWDIW